MLAITRHLYETLPVGYQATGRSCNITLLECKFEEKIFAGILISGCTLRLPLKRIHNMDAQTHEVQSSEKKPIPLENS
jgi:hypothetical protein